VTTSVINYSGEIMLQSTSSEGLKGKRVLIVEDELLIAMMLETEIKSTGAVVVGPVARVKAALRKVEADTPAAAVLDVRLHDEDVFPVADALVGRGIPFFFLSGHGADGLPPRYAGVRCIAKPFLPHEPIAALVQIFGD
jgi:DNA-binding response OmpR family regulator